MCWWWRRPAAVGGGGGQNRLPSRGRAALRAAASRECGRLEKWCGRARGLGQGTRSAADRRASPGGQPSQPCTSANSCSDAGGSPAAGAARRHAHTPTPAGATAGARGQHMLHISECHNTRAGSARPAEATSGNTKCLETGRLMGRCNVPRTTGVRNHKCRDLPRPLQPARGPATADNLAAAAETPGAPLAPCV